jgi:ankyrin repeat protein
LKNNLDDQDKVDGILSCIHVLIEHGARWMQDEIKNNSELFDRVKEIFNKEQINPNLQTEVSATPLSMAVRNGHLDMVKSLIKNGAVVDMDYLSIAANSDVKNADTDEIVRELIDALFNNANPSSGVSLFSENDAKFYKEAVLVFNQFIQGKVEAHALASINQAFRMYPFKEIVQIVGEPALISLHDSAKEQMLRSKNI